MARWEFMNTELTVHLLRPPEGEWVCLDARTFLGGGSVGLAASDVIIEVVHGPVGHGGEFDGPVQCDALTGNGDGTYHGSVAVTVAGGYGVTARIVPHHAELASPHDLGLVTWA